MEEEKTSAIEWKNADRRQIENFKQTAENIFAPVYRVLARQVVDDYKIRDGICIDIGSGTGGFGIEIAKITDMQVYLIDINEKMIGLIKERIEKENLEGRVKAVEGDVHSLPFDDDFADLVVSRGSFHFWHDRRDAFSEIYRILKKGGTGFIGGGFGRDKNVRETAMALHEETFKSVNDGKGFHETLGERYENLREILEGREGFNIIFDKSGLWVEIRKK